MKRYERRADEPIIRSRDDKFDRSEFAEALADSLFKVPQSSSFTVALYGSWGSGKTSVINMALDYLEQKYKSKTIIIHFNPWVFSSPEKLHFAFFETLASNLGERLSTKKEEIYKLLTTYGEATGNIVSFAYPIAGPIGKIISAAGRVAKPKPLSVDSVKNKVDAILKDSGKRVVVVIDDIDRLDSDEIHQVFKLVKNVAHFSNISYLLSFDRSIVSEALSKRYLETTDMGANFIDKIVQLPLYMPPVNHELLVKFLTDELDKIIASYGFEILEEDISRFQSTLFVHGADRLFTTPRNVVRYLNTVDFSVARLSNEVSFSDLALLDLLRIFYADIYHRISENKSLMLKGGERSRDDESKKKAISRIFGRENPAGIEIRIINELFPTFEWALGGSSYAGDFISSWEEAKRICSDKYFDRYFAYGIPTGDLRDSKLQAFMAKLKTEEDVVEDFKALLKESDANIVISKLRRYEDKLAEPESLKLAACIASIGPSLPRPSQALAGDMFSPYIQSAILTVKLIRYGAQPYIDIQRLIQTLPIDYSAEIFRWTRVNSENDGNDPNFRAMLPLDKISDLGKLLAKRIYSYSKSDFIQRIFPEDTPLLFYIWEKYGEKKDIYDYLVSSFNKDPKLAIDFIITFVGYSYDLGSGIRRRSDFRREAYDSIAKIVNPEIFVKPLTELYKIEDLSDYPEMDSKDIEISISKQFIYIHRMVKKA